MANEFKAKNGLIAPIVHSTVSTGTAPIVVASTTKVTNLNVDQLDGYDSGDFPRKAENATISGEWTVNNALTVNGDFKATTKSFLIEHPTKPKMFLQHGSLESPYHGVRHTGRDTVVDGRCVVRLPDYMSALVKTEGATAQITNIRHGITLWVDELNIETSSLVVACAHTKGMYDFYWTVTAIRKDIPDLTVEFAHDSTKID